MNIGVLVSGGGTNLQSIIDKIEGGYLKGVKISCVISGRKNAYALKRAEKHGIPGLVVARRDYPHGGEYDKAIIGHLKKYSVDLVVLAGFMSILGEEMINEYKGRMINIHPSLIPSFCGKGFYGIIPHEKALEYGVKITGATVHFVDLQTDGGPVILQRAVPVLEDDTAKTLQLRVMEEAEHVILPMAIKLISQGRVKIEGRRVKILRGVESD